MQASKPLLLIYVLIEPLLGWFCPLKSVAFISKERNFYESLVFSLLKAFFHFYFLKQSIHVSNHLELFVLKDSQHFHFVCDQ
jgi:hypothetical protein